MPFLPRKFSAWPEYVQDLPPAEIVKLYESGFAGATYSPQAWEEFAAAMSDPDGEAAAHAYGIADTGAGKLVIPFVFVQELYGPNCYPGAAQQRGDCVSHGSKNATLITMCCDIASGKLDEVTGKPEEKPDVPEEGIASGVLSSEAFYWWRGYNGDGWHCPAVAKVATTTSGAFPRRNYADLGVDLTRYSGKNAGLYGSRQPPENIKSFGGAHRIHQATSLDSFESVRDYLFNGYGIIDCGSEGYSSTRDSNGVSKRSGSWAHSMSKIGADDRHVIHQLYGGPLELILNSWGRWNSGPRDIHMSASLVPPEKKEAWIKAGIVNQETGAIMIPEGSFWAKRGETKNRENIAYSGVNGWPKKSMPIPWIF